MALRYEDIQRLKYETGYNVANVGAELYVLNGYAAVFDAAIAPYLTDQGSSSTTVVAASGTGAPVNTTITLAANPNIAGATVNVYGACFQQGSRLVVDVGPNQERDVIIQSLSGLVATVALQYAHGPAAYPVLLQGGEFLVRDILARLDIINTQLRTYAPQVAGLSKADEVEFFANRKGASPEAGVLRDLLDQRDWARKDLAAALGIENLWERRGKGSASAASLELARY